MYVEYLFLVCAGASVAVTAVASPLHHAYTNTIRHCLHSIFFYFDTVALLFLFMKHYSIMEQLGLTDSSRDLQINYAISYLFYLYLMFHAYAARFDVIVNIVKF